MKILLLPISNIGKRLTDFFKGFNMTIAAKIKYPYSTIRNDPPTLNN